MTSLAFRKLLLMTGQVGVSRPIRNLVEVDQLKRWILLFERIQVAAAEIHLLTPKTARSGQFRSVLSWSRMDEPIETQVSAQLDWLQSQGLLIFASNFAVSEHTSGWDLVGEMLRLQAAQTRAIEGIEAVPIRNDDWQFRVCQKPSQFGSLARVYEVVIDKLPMPSQTTSWEHILEFRSDPDTQKKLLRLRIWMRKIATTMLDSTKTEIIEELQALLDEYEDHMRRAKLKWEYGFFETVLTTAGEAFKNLPLVNFGSILKIPLTIRQRKVSLLEEEAKAPGREIAYIAKAHSALE